MYYNHSLTSVIYKHNLPLVTQTYCMHVISVTQKYRIAPVTHNHRIMPKTQLSYSDPPYIIELLNNYCIATCTLNDRLQLVVKPR
jgi:hypothetical protein